LVIKGSKLKIIIDGYNLIKRALGVQHVPPAKLDHFLNLIGNFAKNRNHQLVIIFDGGDTSFPYKETKYGMELIYSGYQESADDVIGRYVSERRGQEMFVVTSDREVANFAAACGVDILNSEEFYELLKVLGVSQDTKMFDTPAHKITDSVDSELDDLMKMGSEQMIVKEESSVKTRQSSAKKLSKAERQKQRKLKKI
jgi:predicted RNA-binding protein with PIN domain